MGYDNAIHRSKDKHLFSHSEGAIHLEGLNLNPSFNSDVYKIARLQPAVPATEPLYAHSIAGGQQ
jgi:hypothetical protein